VLILGGTTEARELAAACADRPEVRTVTSLAGLVTVPARPAGELRTGGFGGVDGLAAYLRTERIDALVDATHPFAVTMTGSAVAAAGQAGVPFLVLRRPGWTRRDGDAWRRVPSVAAAATVVPDLGERVLLTTGRLTLAAFAGVDRCWFLARSVEPPTPPWPARLEVLLGRGPFSLDAERAMLDRHRIEVLVTKDSGGPGETKLTAARERGIPVVMVDRPPLPSGVPVVPSVPAAAEWLASVSSAGDGAAGTCP
jgi:precorrin-6A/cobalt-precorrin-6A reductase